MKYYPFANGDTLPALGLATWKSEKGKVYQAIKDAIKIGYTPVQPREWFLVPLEVIEKIKEGTIDQFQYDPKTANLTRSRSVVIDKS